MINYATSESVEGNKQKSTIKRQETLAEVYSSSFPVGDIQQILDTLEKHVKIAATAKGIAIPNQQAFSNARGSWFETIIAAYAWNYRIGRGLNCFFIKMPNVKSFDFRRVFEKNTRKIVDNLSLSLANETNPMRMTLSNPDILFVKGAKVFPSEFEIPIANLSLKNTHKLDHAYQYMNSNFNREDILGGVGLATSLRPDRRLQLILQGNILKSMFAHINERLFEKSDMLSFSYYVASSESVSSHVQAFEMVSTHSIINANTKRERAVDNVFSITDTDKITVVLNEITKDLT